MKCNISYKNIEPSQSLEYLIHQKMRHFDKYDNSKNSYANWVINIHNKIHQCDVLLSINNHTFHADTESSDMHKNIDLIIQKLESQVSRKSDKRKH